MTPPDPRDPNIEALLRGAVTPGAPDMADLAALRLRCWPGGGDRSVRIALEWLRRWGPSRAMAPAPQCGCATGRCGVCN